MPKRATVKRHETDEVQGEGSYVVVTGIKVKEIRQLRERAREVAATLKRGEDAEDFDEFEASLALVAKHITDWNWVDDDEQPLPVPNEHPEVMDELTNEEAIFLTELLIGKDEAKN